MDEAWLRWIAQHRFVGVDALMVRFDVQRSAAWRRVGRLVDARLLVRVRTPRATVFHLSARSWRLLGLRRRRPPAAVAAMLDHDLAVAVWHAELTNSVERRGDGDRVLVLSERALRERHTATRPYCARVRGARGEIKQRWPDVAVEHPDGALHAFELEFSDKGRARLQSILRGYVLARRITRVTYYVTTPALAGRLAKLAAGTPTPDLFEIAPWHDVEDTVAERICARVAAASQRARRAGARR